MTYLYFYTTERLGLVYMWNLCEAIVMIVITPLHLFWYILYISYIYNFILSGVG